MRENNPAWPKAEIPNRLRRAVPADALGILLVGARLIAADEAVHSQGWDDWTEGRLAALIEAPDSAWFVSEDDDRVVGWLSLSVLPLAKVKHNATLGMGVLATHRSRGRGRELVLAAICWAWDNPALRRIELMVFNDNLHAQDLYESCGFRFEGRRREAIFKDGKYIDAWDMALHVNNERPVEF